MKKILILSGMILLVMQSATYAYDVDVDSIAYKVILWRNSNPNDSVTVTGLVNGAGEHPECTVQTFREKRGRDTYWTINVTPKDNWGVFEVRYPMLFLPKFTPYHDYLIYGRQMGQKFGFTDLANRAERYPSMYYRGDTTGYPELVNKTVIFDGRYPWAGSMNMQMMMYENDAGQGVMIWTPDSTPWVKDFIINKSELDAAHQSLGWRAYISHYPENTGQIGTGFQSPYPVVTTPYTNGWYEAALIYKRWARSQWWCSKGKLYDRPGTPQWLKDTHLWGGGGWFGLTAGMEQVIALRDQVVPGKNLVVQSSSGTKYFNILLTSAPDHLPLLADEESFMWSLAQRAQGIHLASLCEFNWATICYENFATYEPWTVKKQNGSPVHYASLCDFNYYLNGFPGAWLSAGFVQLGQDVLNYKQALHDAWYAPINQALIDQMDQFPMLPSRCASQKQQLTRNWGGNPAIIDNLQFESSALQLCMGDNRMLDHCLATADEYFQNIGASALYIDTYPAHSVACYDPNHGHPIGFGRYIAQNSHDLLAQIVADSPQAVIVSESAGMEQFMDTLQVEYMKDMGADPAYIVPLNKIIYHGFIEKTGYPLFYGTPGVYTNASDFCVALAFTTHLGYMPGSPAGYGVLQHCGSDANKAQFLNQTIEIRKAYRDYLAAGEPLPDPVVSGPGSVPVSFKWFNYNGTYSSSVLLPPVQATKWSKRNDPAKVLLLLSNASGQPQTVTLEGGTITMNPYSWKAIESFNSHEEYYFDVGGPEDTGNTLNNNPTFGMAINEHFAWYFQDPSEEDGYSVRKSTGYAAFFVNLPSYENSYFNYKNAKIRIAYKTAETTELMQYCGPAYGWVGIGPLTGDGQWRTNTFQLDSRFHDYCPASFPFPGINIVMTFYGNVSGGAVPITVADLWLINDKTKTDAELDVGAYEDDALFEGHVPGVTLATEEGGFSAPFVFESRSYAGSYTVREALGTPYFFVNLPDGEKGLFPSAPKVSVLYKAAVSNTVLQQFCGGTNNSWVSLGNLLCDGQWHIQTFQLDPRHYDYISAGYGKGENILMLFNAPVTVAKLWLENAVADAYLDVGAGDQYGLNPNDASDADGDLDNDGLTNLEEYQNGWNPLDPNSPPPAPVDTDGDGMPDYWETQYGFGFNPNEASDASGDLDNDGHTNLEEYQMGWNPADPNSPPPPPPPPADTDSDGMPNSWETQYGLNPNNASDASGDLDNDGHTNLDEYQHDWNPANPNSPPPPPPPPADTDSDGMPDSWETQYGLNPNNASDASGDLDNDGHTNLKEYQKGWNPTDPNSPPPPPADTDSDGMPDTWETQYGLNPNNPSDASGDLDSDGNTNLDEYKHGWNPVDPNSPPPPPADTDSDGMPDSWETQYGLNPNNPSDANSDLDNDGNTNLSEFQHGWNPTDPNSPPPPPPLPVDTDGDGMPDYWEIRYGPWGGHTPGFSMSVAGGHFAWTFGAPSVVDGYTVRESLGYACFFVNIPEGEEARYAGAKITIMYKTAESTALYQFCGTSWVSIGNLTGDGQWHVATFSLDNRFYDYTHHADTPDVNVLMSFYGASSGWGVHLSVANLWLKKAAE